MCLLTKGSRVDNKLLWIKKPNNIKPVLCRGKLLLNEGLFIKAIRHKGLKDGKKFAVLWAKFAQKFPLRGVENV